VHRSGDEGSFQYRTTAGEAVLAPGAVLLGNHSHCFECGHEHATGDRCLSFRFAPDYLEAIVADVPGVRRAEFANAHLPPLPELIPLVAAAEAAREAGANAEFEEMRLRLAAAVACTMAGAGRSARQPNRRDVKRVTEALRRIAATISDEPHARITLTGLARDAATSPYHFLRTFRDVVGMTPHQYILRARLHRAAVCLRGSKAPVSAIAFDAGFGDLSTFNRRFGLVFGAAPSAYRARRRPAPQP
jgi:AraC-like DNA-binding protein